MATDYFSDHELFGTSNPLVSPSDTNSLAPLSRKSSRIGSPLTDTAESPPPLPTDNLRAPQDVSQDDVPQFDPRRFTPTLHASLVSEILNLRRELDSKHRFIEDLEGTLSEVKIENDTLHDQAGTTAKENRKFKHQLQELEKGTLAALEDLARDRDEAHSANSDLKAKLETAQTKIRNQQNDSDRSHSLFERDKDSWANEKRSLERRVHVSETRLKAVLDELQNHVQRHEHSMDSEAEDQARDSGFGNESDTTSIRSLSRMDSRASTRHRRTISNSSQRSYGRGIRYSVLSGTGSEAFPRSNGMTLADELNLDEEDEDLEEIATDSDDFPEHELRARRALESRQSNHADEKAKRILGLSESRASTMTPEEGNRTRQIQIQPIPEPVMEPFRVQDITRPPSQPVYVDSSVQFTPPSPPLSAQESSQVKYEYTDAGVQVSSQEPEVARETSPVYTDVGVQFSRPSTPEAPIPSVFQSASTSTQTEPYPAVEVKPSLPDPETRTTSTQTDVFPEPQQSDSVIPPAPSRTPPPPPTTPAPVPSITIHPPASAPNSPKEGILPPGTKNASSQTSFESTVRTRSCAMQTEPIRIDKRPVKLPPHLLPSALSHYLEPQPTKDKKESVEPKPERKPLTISTELPASNATRNAFSAPNSASTVHTEDRYPGNNDNGPLNREKAEGIRRPFRSSSLFAGFDEHPSDEEDSDDNFSDREDSKLSLTARSQRSRLKHSRPFTPVPEEKESSTPQSHQVSSGKGKAVIYGTTTDKSMDLSDQARGSFEKSSRVSKASRGGNLSRTSSMRRSALISSGAAAHVQRSRSPSFGSVTTGGPMPPFPVPTRSSSRRVPLSKSEGSPTSSRSRGTFNTRRVPGATQSNKRDSLRKIRSATTIPRNGRSRSPPMPATPSDWEPTPQLPPLRHGLASPLSVGAPTRMSHISQPSTNTSFAANSSSASSGPQISVVDAIAATMVGEWMWKYVRRGAFGVSASQVDVSKPGDDSIAMSSANGVRHKRWVWLSPYERSIMWSSKQPTSGTALMGKSGRKLTIQSVLDVRDDSTIPKNANPQEVFNRSILVLTPARALKFTATSRERHYLWLTALSFLAHSVGPLGDEINPSLLSLSPAVPSPSPAVSPTVELQPAPKTQGATLRRSHIRDSVRLAKSKDHMRPRRPTLHGTIDELHDSTSPPPIPDLNGEAATPPTIPRYSQHNSGPQVHGRKRSLTGPRSAGPAPTTTAANSMPHALLRSFSSQPYQVHKHAPSSATTSTNSDNYHAGVHMPPSVPSSLYNPSSTRTSEAGSSVRNNFFEAIGTHRMEAFVGSMQQHSGYRGRFGSEASDGSGAIPPPVPRMRAGRGASQKAWEEDSDPFRGF